MHPGTEPHLPPKSAAPLDPFGLAGETLAGKYDVERVVAETELSVIYRASHRVWRRPIAIKVFKSHLIDERARDQMLEAFVREGAILMDLSERSAAICQARDVGSTLTASGDWLPYTVLEWLEGETLEDLLARERAPRPVNEAIDLLDPIAEALALAHERGVVHRDVKPGNVFILAGHEPGRERYGARCKLLDFGIAKSSDAVTVRTSLDRALPRSFTPAYAAPEQFAPTRGATGPWTDVFALALVFVELVSGGDALRGETLEELEASSVDRLRRPTPRALGARVNDDVERVLGKALAVDASERYRDAGDFWFALKHAAAKRPPAVRPPTPSQVAIDLSPGDLPRSLSSLPPMPSARPSLAARVLRMQGRMGPRSRWIVAGAAVVGICSSIAVFERYGGSLGGAPVAVGASAARGLRSLGQSWGTLGARPHLE